ncbi:MAG: dTMP kinase [Rhodospirillales bacterium]|nr:dTMP kinase [Rhodospirillales bacterium]
MSAQSCFISIEGGEGTGKSTQVGLLGQYLSDKGLDIIQTREPGGSEGAEEIRQLLVTGAPGRWDAITETLLHFAARRDHLETLIKPALARGQWVISDRFADSTTAYQGYGHGVDLLFIDELYRKVVGNFAPDLTLVLDLPVKDALKRAIGRGFELGSGEDRYEQMEIEFHSRLRQGFFTIAETEPERCALVDATGSSEDVHGRITSIVGSRLGDKLP